MGEPYGSSTAGLGDVATGEGVEGMVELFIAATLLFAATGAVRGRSGAVGVFGRLAARFEDEAVTLPGTRKGRCVYGQTTLEPADIPRTSTRRGGFVNGVRT